MESCEKHQPPSGCLLTAAHRVWHFVDICSNTLTFTYTSVSWDGVKDHSWTKRSVDSDVKSCAAISIRSCFQFRACITGEGGRKSGQVADGKLLHLTSLECTIPAYMFPFSAEIPHTHFSICLSSAGHHEWDVPLLGRERNVSVDHSCLSS